MRSQAPLSGLISREQVFSYLLEVNGWPRHIFQQKLWFSLMSPGLPVQCRRDNEPPFLIAAFVVIPALVMDRESGLCVPAQLILLCSDGGSSASH